jgi:hypothetical protein
MLDVFISFVSRNKQSHLICGVSFCIKQEERRGPYMLLWVLEL